MSKKKPAQPEMLRDTPIEVRPQYCSDEELTLHLESFVKSFVMKEDQERWLTFLVEKRSRWYPRKVGRPDKYYHKALSEFQMYFPLQKNGCGSIDGEKAYPQALIETFGTERGVYFDLCQPACKITAAEAASLMFNREGNKDNTAILSFTPGKRALFFDYEMDEGYQCIWLCKRT